jgi:23S rRNA (adenine2503-C2)-methyltransferase
MKKLAEIENLFKELGIPAFRVKQLCNAVYQQGISNYQEISTFPQTIKDKLESALPISSIKPVLHVISQKKDTEKALFEINGGFRIEAVLMKYRDGRNTICISSQAGCQMGCKFCATGAMKFGRNLTYEEIFDQVLYFHCKLMQQDERISNVVFMGMGEPFMNYDNVMDAVRLLNSPDGLGLAARRITVSTSGVVDAINKLTEDPLQVNLALSLHAPTQEIREKIMPIAKRWKLDELIQAIDNYSNKTHRRVSYEYVMLKGINDSEQTAEELAKISKDKFKHINIIPYNSTDIENISGSDRATILNFQKILQNAGVSATVRVTMGEDIAAACGQLANKNKQK